MPGTSGQTFGALPGLQLRAWVLFAGATGAVVKQSGVSSVTRSSPGAYAVNLASAMPDTNIIGDLQSSQPVVNGSPIFMTYSATVSVVTVSTYVGVTATDFPMVYLAVYG